ncbi:MAG: trypsin-like peptidase domain-containing protein [Clostridiales bacterium]|nr:trypsin-like peptidase domain-containing protein [Clostridiales bacterium]
MENNNNFGFDPDKEKQMPVDGSKDEGNAFHISGEKHISDEGKAYRPLTNSDSPTVYQTNQNFRSDLNHIEDHRKKTKRKGLLVFASIVIAAALLFTGAVTGVTIVDYYRSNAVPNNGEAQSTGSAQDLPKDSVKLHINDVPKGTVSAASTSSQGLDTSIIAEKVKPSVVGVISENTANPAASAQGSGIVMTKDGYIITNNHVIEGANKITVVLENGNKYNAKIIGKDAKTDLAVLKINASNLPAAEFGNSDELKVGDKAIAIGNPMGIELQGTVTQGIISAINRDITVEDRVMTLLQTDASINPGNSGGPLVNKYGQVIGINTVKIGQSDYEGLGFAIPMNTAKPIIDELIAYGYVKGRPAIGISGRNMTEQAANYYGVPMGVLVDTVDPKCDAYKQGLMAQDVIYGVNGKTITTMNEIQKIKDSMKVGQSITLNIYRAGQRLNITIKLVDESSLSSSSNKVQINPDISGTP